MERKNISISIACRIISMMNGVHISRATEDKLDEMKDERADYIAIFVWSWRFKPQEKHFCSHSQFS